MRFVDGYHSKQCLFDKIHNMDISSGWKHWVLVAEPSSPGAEHYHIAVSGKSAMRYTSLKANLEILRATQIHVLIVPGGYYRCFEYLTQPSRRKGRKWLDPKPIFSKDHPRDSDLAAAVKSSTKTELRQALRTLKVHNLDVGERRKNAGDLPQFITDHGPLSAGECMMMLAKAGPGWQSWWMNARDPASAIERAFHLIELQSPVTVGPKVAKNCCCQEDNQPRVGMGQEFFTSVLRHQEAHGMNVTEFFTSLGKILWSDPSAAMGCRHFFFFGESGSGKSTIAIAATNLVGARGTWRMCSTETPFCWQGVERHSVRLAYIDEIDTKEVGPCSWESLISWLHGGHQAVNRKGLPPAELSDCRPTFITAQRWPAWKELRFKENNYAFRRSFCVTHEFRRAPNTGNFLSESLSAACPRCTRCFAETAKTWGVDLEISPFVGGSSTAAAAPVTADHVAPGSTGTTSEAVLPNSVRLLILEGYRFGDGRQSEF